jgi:hypothetical protein
MMDTDALRTNPVAFRDRLQIDGAPWLRDDWQESFLQACDPGWRRAIGQQVDGGHSRAWSLRPRGHSKTTDLACMTAWALFAARRPIRGVVAAADMDQARLLGDALQRLLAGNPWLARFLEVQRGRAVNPHTGAELQILTSDAPTSYGLLCDFIVCDELTVWRSRDLFDSLLSAAAKRSDCMLAIISNAGWQESWQYDLWRAIQADPAWLAHQVHGAVASWMSQRALDEQRRLLPAIQYDRLWNNKWMPGAGGAISGDDLAAAITQSGPMRGDEPGCLFAGAVDLGVSHDHSAVAIVGVKEGGGRVRLAWSESWAPNGGKVDLRLVRRRVAELHRQFHCVFMVDPSQAELMMQDLAMVNVPTFTKKLTTPAQAEMAQAVVAAFKQRCIDLYRDEMLLSDLAKLNIQERGFGLKLTAPSDKETGHADRAIALAMLMPGALAIAMDDTPQAIGRRIDELRQQQQLGHDPTWGQPCGLGMPGSVDVPFDPRAEFGRRRQR